MLLVASSRASDRALLQGIANYSRQHRSWSLYWEPGLLENAWLMLRSMEVDGIILQDPGNAGEILPAGIPALVLGRGQNEIPGVVQVVTDDEAIGRMGGEHLLACGFRHFAFCRVDDMPGKQAACSRVRQESFAEVVAAAGCKCHWHIPSRMARQTVQQKRQDLARWLLSLPSPAGVMACSDDNGVQVMEACKLAGLRVPEAVGILGVDNDELLCNLGDPSMSSVAINYERAGYDAAQALDQAMRLPAAVPAKIIMASPTHVMARRSTDAAAAQDPHLARALRVIRARVSQPLPVDEVARAAGLSRRALERRFRAEMGHSILEEIRRLRTDRIARLLVESRLPIGHIADAMGFEDVRHFARYFRSSRQISPLAYRRMFGACPGAGSVSQIGERLPQDGVEARGFRPVKLTP
ncbi:MAG: substrate-binding domain-containing protein [Verrucomicrobiota bacterium]